MTIRAQPNGLKHLSPGQSGAALAAQRRPGLQAFSYQLVLAGLHVMTEDITEALFAAGCDDGSPHSGNGVAAVGFDREAPSLEQAIASAVADVKKAGFDVARVELSGDEIALLRA